MYQESFEEADKKRKMSTSGRKPSCQNTHKQGGTNKTEKRGECLVGAGRKRTLAKKREAITLKITRGTAWWKVG